MYDFHKSRQENNENEFCHKLFKKGQKQLLSEIKRKTTETQNESNQLVPVTKELDFEKFKKEAGQFANDLKTLKTRQGDLEKITKIIFSQNTKLLKENKLLWNELIKNKEKYERKIEKLMLFVFSIMQYSGNNKNAITFGNKKGLGTGDASDTLENFETDNETVNNELDQNNTSLSVLPEKKDHDKFFKKIAKYFQSKGNKTSLDNLLEMAQKGTLSNFLNGQANLLGENQEEKDINLDWLDSSNERFRNGTKNPLKRNHINYLNNEFSPDEILKEQPSKYIKLEPEIETDSPKFLPQAEELPNLELLPAPSNMASAMDFDLGQPDPLKNLEFNSPKPTSIIPYSDPQIPSFDFLSNPRNVFPISRQDSMISLNKPFEDKDPFEFGQRLNNNNIDEGIGCYSPSAFINGNDNFGFEQPLDESFERNE